MEGRVSWTRDEQAIADTADAWRAAGATHLSVNTMGAGLRTVDDHIGALSVASEALRNE
jgi:hypothetical protein